MRPTDGFIDAFSTNGVEIQYVIKPDTAFTIHFFLFKDRIAPSYIKLAEIDQKCEINNLEITEKHCDFLEYKKYLIRNWEHHEGPETGYQQIQPGDEVMRETWRRIIAKLRGFNDEHINLILDDAAEEIDEFKIIAYIYEKGIEHRDKLPLILETVYDEYWGYLNDLKVFQIKIEPDELDVTRSRGQIRIQGTISKPYQKTSGKIPIRIFLLDLEEDKEMETFAKFVGGIIDGAINFPQGYKAGNHTLIGYFQLEGETSQRWEAYANSGKISFTIISR